MLEGLRIKRSQLSLMLLLLLGAAAIVAMAKLRTRDTALRVIGHEWETMRRFGDLNDPESVVARMAKEKSIYLFGANWKTGPTTRYMTVDPQTCAKCHE